VTADLPGTETSNSTLALFNGNLHADLGVGVLTSVTAYSHSSFSGPQDATDTFGRFVPLIFPDGAPEPLGVAVSNFETTNKFSEEVRFAAKRIGGFEWQLGGFYTNESDAAVQNVDMNSVSTGQVLGGAPELYTTFSPGHYIEWAMFGSATEHFTDQFDVQIGARYSWQAQHNVLDVGGVLGSPPSSADQDSKANAFTYSLTPRWHLTPDMMVYARVATGYRPGGANTSPGVPLDFAHDTTTNYEVGFKGNAIPGLLTLELSLFDIQWKDIQLIASAPSGFSYTSNGGTARSDGVELTAALTPLPGLTVTANVDYDDAILTRTLPSNAQLVASDGDRLPYSAKVTASLAADQNFRITGQLTGNVGMTVAYVGDRLNEFSINSVDPLTGASLGVPPRFRLPSYQTVDLHTGFDYDTWNATLYVRNVANKYGLVSTFRRDAITLYGNYGTQVIDPRTVGLSVTKRF
jgi:outer membrane receptor protein involved in Fe transport